MPIAALVGSYGLAVGRVWAQAVGKLWAYCCVMLCNVNAMLGAAMSDVLVVGAVRLQPT